MADMTNRSRLSVVATLCWVLLFVVLISALSPGWVGQVLLFALALIGALVLGNFDTLASAWREDKEAKRPR